MIGEKKNGREKIRGNSPAQVGAQGVIALRGIEVAASRGEQERPAASIGDVVGTIVQRLGISVMHGAHSLALH